MKSSSSPVSPSAGITTAAAIESSCPVSGAPPKGGAIAEKPSLGIREIQEWVEQSRGLMYKHHVDIVNVTNKGLAERIAATFDNPADAELLRDQGRVFQTIGAIPAQMDLLNVARKALTAGVSAYYDPTDHQLVSPGVNRLAPVDKFILSHEFTHALDDQYFELAKTSDPKALDCSADRVMAANAVIEGNATWVSFDVVGEHFSPEELSSMIRADSSGGAGISKGVPNFVIDSITWPYLNGRAFIAARLAEGGSKAVDRTFETFPASTEQIMHPSKYPKDEPVAVEVPDYAPALGAGWQPLFASDAGEADLSILLSQRLAQSEATEAAAGWGGGTIRSWSKGDDTAVVLGTIWDSNPDAVEFADAMREYVETLGLDAAVVTQLPDGVTVVLGSSPQVLEDLQAATG